MGARGDVIACNAISRANLQLEHPLADILGRCQVISLRALFKRWLNCNKVRPRSRAKAVSVMFATLLDLFHEGSSLATEHWSQRQEIAVENANHRDYGYFQCSAAGTMLAYFVG
jgi:hypothetical protein